MQSVRERLRLAASENQSPRDRLIEAAADNAPLSDRLQQVASSFVGNAAGVVRAGLGLEARMREAVPVIGPVLSAPHRYAQGVVEDIGTAIPPVLGQEEKLYSQAAGALGSSMAMAPAAIGGPLGIGLAGAAVGAEQQMEEAEAHGASSKDVALAALGGAFLGYTERFGAGKALARFGVKPGSIGADLVREVVEEAPQEFGQAVGGDALARATYDPAREIRLGRALESAMAATVAVGGLSAGVSSANLLRAAAENRRSRAAAASPSAQESGISPDGGAMPVPEPSVASQRDLSEISPAADLTGADRRSFAEQLFAETPIKVIPPIAQGPAEPQLAPTSGASPTQAAEPLLSPLPASAPEAATYPGETAAGGVAATVTNRDQPLPTVPQPSPTVDQPFPTVPASPPSPGEETALPSPDDAASPAGDGGAPNASIKNRIVDEELAAMGLPPPTPAERLSFEEANRRAEETMARDPFAGRKLLDELSKSERAIDGEEVALLTRERNRLRLERDRAEQALVEAANRNEDTTVVKAEIERIRSEFGRTAETLKHVGTKTAQGLALRRMELREDYSVANLERELLVANEGKPLTEEQHALIRKTRAELDAAIKAHDAYVADVGARLEEIEHELAAFKAKREPRPVRQRRITQFVTARANEARARIKARGVRLMAGIDPIDLADRAIVGAEYIVKGFTEFAEWSKHMVHELGESVRPHLPAIFEASKAKAVEYEQESPVLRGQKTRMANVTARLKEAIESKDFTPKQKRKILALDAEGVRLRNEMEKVKREFRRGVEKARLENRSKGEVALDLAKEGLDLPKALKSSFDLSALFRQGGFFTLGHPVQAVQWTRKMIRAARDADFSERMDLALRERRLADFGERSGLDLTRHGDDLGKHEEAIRSQWSDRIPIVGRGIKLSNRAYISFLNVQRATMFDQMVNAIPGEPTLEQGKAIANAVNIGSGRGNAGKFAGAISGLSHILWSPRLLLSRFQLLAGQPLYRGDKFTRMLIAKEYARSLIGLAAVYSLAQLAGIGSDEPPAIEADPRSSDFGKIRLGRARLDPLSGLSQVTVFLSRLGVGESKRLSGDVVPIRGEDVPYGSDTSYDVIARFLRTKLSPTIGVPIDFLSGETVIGEEPKIVDVVLPLSFRDIYEALQEKGVPAGAALGILSFFGMSLQVHQPKEKKK